MMVPLRFNVYFHHTIINGKMFEKCNGFQWDKGNSEKNWLKHKVLKFECEQVFFKDP